MLFKRDVFNFETLSSKLMQKSVNCAILFFIATTSLFNEQKFDKALSVCEPEFKSRDHSISMRGEIFNLFLKLKQNHFVLFLLWAFNISWMRLSNEEFIAKNIFKEKCFSIQVTYNGINHC